MLKDNDWSFILDTIKNEKCILLIGPEVCIAETGKQYDQALLEHLNIKDNDNILSYYEKDGLFLYKDGIAKTRSYYKIKDFYKHGFKDANYDKLTEIPFHLIISTSPDTNLRDVFKSKNLLCEFEYYDKTINPKNVKTPTKSIPLIYNLFGSIDKEESMILTHDDLFDFLLAILGSRNLPGELKNALRTADNFLFLGFKFDKWYVQLLLRLLNLHNEQYKFARFASNKVIKPETRSLIIDQFRIEFVDDQIEKFVDILHNKCDKEGILRKPEAGDISVYDLVNICIENDEIDKAFQHLKNYPKIINDEELMDELRLLMGKYRRLLKKINEGILTDKETDIEFAKIRKALSDFNKDINLFE